MLRCFSVTGLLVLSVSLAQQLAAQGNTSAKMVDYAAAFGNAAGNDLANEIVIRIDNGKDAQLKKLISTPALAEGLRRKCKDAVQRVVEQESSPLLWQVTAVDDDKARQVLISSLSRSFSLDLGEGLKWDQKVSVSWSSGRLVVGKSDQPVKTMMWVAFGLPTLSHLGGGDMHIGGGTSVRTGIDP